MLQSGVQECPQVSLPTHATAVYPQGDAPDTGFLQPPSTVYARTSELCKHNYRTLIRPHSHEGCTQTRDGSPLLADIEAGLRHCSQAAACALRRSHSIDLAVVPEQARVPIQSGGEQPWRQTLCVWLLSPPNPRSCEAGYNISR